MTESGQPLVSVLLPVKNGAAFVVPAVGSIINQSHRNVQIVIVDDGSTDATPDLLRSMAARDSRIQVLSRPASGVTPSLNAGIDACEGAYIARMDHDDISHPDRIALQLAYLLDQDLDVCGTWACVFGQRCGLIRFPVGAKAFSQQMVFSGPILHPSAMFRASALRRFRYRPHAPLEDYELYTRMWSAKAKMGNLPLPLIHYRVHSDQITRMRRVLHRAYGAELGFQHFLALSPESDLTERSVIRSVLDPAQQNLDPTRLENAGEILLRRLRPDDDETRALLLHHWRRICRDMACGLRGWRGYNRIARQLRRRFGAADCAIAWSCRKTDRGSVN